MDESRLRRPYAISAVPSANPFRGSILKADWPVPHSVHAFTTLRGLAGTRPEEGIDRLNLGARGNNDPAVALRNRHALVADLQLPSPPHWLQQVHGSAVVTFETPAVSRCEPPDAEAIAGILQTELTADAATTRTTGVVLAILTADCLPVLFSSDDGSEIGAAHAGWRGLSAGVLERTIETMRTPPSQLVAWLGPAIGAGSYEVGDEVRAAFVDRDGDAAEAFVATRPGHWLCDLYELARRRLAGSGVTRVRGGGFDTRAEQRFHSWRRDGARSGRMASLVWISPAR